MDNDDVNNNMTQCIFKYKTWIVADAYTVVLLLARTRLIFTTARRGHDWDLEIIPHHLMSSTGNAGGGPFRVR